MKIQFLTILLFGLLCDSVSAQVMADMAVINAKIITVNSDQPWAEALAVWKGKIVAVGTNQDVEKLIDAKTQVIDGTGKTITPGFIDAHLHPQPIFPFESVHAQVDISPASVDDMEEMIALLQKKAAITPEGQWIRGSRYQDTKLGRHPTRYDLDRVSTRHPITISHSSGHVRVFNSYALEAAGITKDTQDPAGGGFDRDENGVPNGICPESPASSKVTRGNKRENEPNREELVEGYRLCFEAFLAKGITGVGDAGISPGKWEIYQQLVNSGMPVRIYAMFRETYLPDLVKVKMRSGFGNDHLKIGSIKLFHGNSLSGRTCWLYEPYEGRPDYYGIPPARTQDELNQLILQIHEAGFQAAVHANGDREIDMVLNAFEEALKKEPRNGHRHRIEHASVCNSSILEKAKRLGVVLALHSYIFEHGDKMLEYGPKRWPMMHPNRSCIDMGIPVAGNSDSPVSAADPLLRIQSLVTQTTAEGMAIGKEQKITPLEAIKIFTLGSAYAQFEENIKGSIEPGKVADFVILSDDPTQVDPFSIKDIQVEATFIDGKKVFQ